MKSSGIPDKLNRKVLIEKFFLVFESMDVLLVQKLFLFLGNKSINWIVNNFILFCFIHYRGNNDYFLIFVKLNYKDDINTLGR